MNKIIKKDDFTLEEIQKSCSTINMNKAYVCAQLTDRFILDDLNSEGLSKINISKLLDIRVFNNATELRWFRGSIDTDFRFRSSEDYINNKNIESYCEEQYLDIDSRKGIDAEGYVYAVGSGKYKLPQEYRYTNTDNLNDIRIIIRNYIRYYQETGQAYIYDWTLAGFKKEGR